MNSHPLNKNILKTMLPANPVILDVGSFDGRDADELSRLFNCDVHCFEMDRENRRKIYSLNNDRLHVWPYIVSKEIGPMEYYRSDNHPQSNSTREPTLHDTYFSYIKFSGNKHTGFATTLDKWSQTTGIKNIDLLWVDVNGAEPDVIAGAGEVLKNTKYLFIEFEEVELFKGGPTRKQMIDLLPDFQSIGEFNYLGNYGNLLFKNITYVGKSNTI